MKEPRKTATLSEEAKIRSQQRRDFILEGNLIKVIFIVALPQVTSMLIDSIYNLTDTYFVSQLGDTAIAAVGINDSLMHLIRATAMGFGMGSASYISRSLGAKKDEEASRAAVTTLFTAMGAIAVLATLARVFLSPLVDFLGATPTIKHYTMDYAVWTLLAAPITGGTVVLAQTLRSEGSTTYSMIGNVSGCVINVILDPIFIHIMGLGVAGAAIATGISKVISFFILLTPFIRKKSVITLKPSFFTPTKAIYAEIAKMGIPTAMRSSMMSFATIITNNVAGSFGDVALASLSIANKSIRLVASGIMGFGQGFQPIAGYCWGAKRYARTVDALKYTATIGAIIGAILGAGLFFFAPLLIQIFSKNPEVLGLGLLFIRTQSVVLIPHVYVMLSNGFFQALGQPVRAAIMGLSRQLLSLIPMVLILPYFFGAEGLACAQAAADLISLCLAAILVTPVIKMLLNYRKQELAGELTQDIQVKPAIESE